jgi:hypothetical protein
VQRREAHAQSYWEASKKHLLSDPKILDRLIAYDKDNISEEVMGKVAPMVVLPDFQPDKVRLRDCFVESHARAVARVRAGAAHIRCCRSLRCVLQLRVSKQLQVFTL